MIFTARHTTVQENLVKVSPQLNYSSFWFVFYFAANCHPKENDARRTTIKILGKEKKNYYKTWSAIRNWHGSQKVHLISCRNKSYVLICSFDLFTSFIKESAFGCFIIIVCLRYSNFLPTYSYTANKLLIVDSLIDTDGWLVSTWTINRLIN